MQPTRFQAHCLYLFVNIKTALPHLKVKRISTNPFRLPISTFATIHLIYPKRKYRPISIVQIKNAFVVLKKFFFKTCGKSSRARPIMLNKIDCNNPFRI
jgi:hypothetical protein